MKRRVYLTARNWFVLLLLLMTAAAASVFGIAAAADAGQPEGVPAASLDVDGNGSIETADAVLLARILAEDISVPEYANDDLNRDGILTLRDLNFLLRYLMGLDTVPPVIETTTTPGTTTSTTETTTTTSTTTETTTTTTTTATETTTTSTTTETTTTTTTTTTATETTITSTTTETTTTTTTTTTATETTTTSTTTETTTTETTTTTTTTTIDEDAARIAFINSVCTELSPTDASIPLYTESDLFETKQGIFLTEINGIKYAYTLLSDDSSLTTGDLIFNINLVKGIHVWKYNGTSEPQSQTLPNTSGLKFNTKDPDHISQGITQMSYSLKNYDKLFYSDIRGIARILLGFVKEYDDDIKCFDYNLNNTIDIDDFKTAISLWTSYIYNPFWGYNEEAFMMYFDSMADFNHENVILHTTRNTTPVPYAINIPTGDFLENFEGSTFLCPVLILPADEYYDIFLANYKHDKYCNDDDYEYIAVDLASSKWEWATVASPSENWYFTAGYYVYALNDDGTYQKEFRIA